MKEDDILWRIDLQRGLSRLDIRELLVCELLNEGYSLVEIARHQKCSYRYIKKVAMVLRKKLRKFFVPL